MAKIRREYVWYAESVSPWQTSDTEVFISGVKKFLAFLNNIYSQFSKIRYRVSRRGEGGGVLLQFFV